jgi:hypothetical protein
MKLYFVLLAALSVLIALPNRVSANATTMRCGSRIVQAGDSMFQVRRICGEPATKAVVGERKVWDRKKHGGSYRGSSVAVTVERWTYDMGRYRFPRIVTFYGDRLAKIELDDMY